MESWGKLYQGLYSRGDCWGCWLVGVRYLYPFLLSLVRADVRSKYRGFTRQMIYNWPLLSWQNTRSGHIKDDLFKVRRVRITFPIVKMYEWCRALRTQSLVWLITKMDRGYQGSRKERREDVVSWQRVIIIFITVSFIILQEGKNRHCFGWRVSKYIL